MNVLAPWFLAGIALVAGPIIAHLIRRATRERVNFSTLRFLDPSAPTLDRRSRVQNPWLLALRCLIVALLALAFARPFLEQTTPPAIVSAPPRHLVAVLDDSASMRRSGLAAAARENILALAAGLNPADRFVLLAAGDRVTDLINLRQWLATPLDARTALVRATLDAHEPGWGPTPLDAATETAFSRWEEMAESADGAGRRELVLVSDFTAGSRVSGLASLDWPADARVTLESVTPSTPGNASLQWLGWSEPTADTPAARIRISRTIDTHGPLQLSWHNPSDNAPLGAPTPVELLPGSSTVLLLPLPENAPPVLRLDLAGDNEPFDNQLFLVRSEPRELTIGYFGPHAANDPKNARFYLERAIGGWREPVARVHSGLPPDRTAPALLVIDAPLDPATLAAVRSRLEAGAFALVLISNPGVIPTAAALAGESSWTAATTGRDDALFGQLDFTHPLFTPFADPLYSDFTRVRFWQPHPVALPPDSPTRVIARFDDNSPAVLETAIGPGRLIVWSGGWSPTASQWVLSSKFVPWLQALAERAVGGVGHASIVEVGDTARLLSTNAPAQWRRIDISDTSPASSEIPAVPGLYTLAQNDRSREVALLTPAAESDLTPLTLDTWERLGVPLTSTDPAAASPENANPTTARNAQAAVLENRQQLWRWLIWAAVALLALESLASFTVSRRRSNA